MTSFVTYDIAVLTVIFTLNIISPVTCQCTVKSCESGDASISMATEIRQMFAEFHECLQAIDRRSHEQDIYMKQVQSIHQLLNISVHQMSSFNESLRRLQDQQDAVMTSLQTVGQPAQRQEDVCAKEVHEILNASIQQNLLMSNQHTSVSRRFDEVMELLRDHDISIKNQSQDSWTTTTGVPLQQTTVNGLEGDHALLPSLNNWTVIMNRFNGSLNFNRSWTEYKNGFGDIGRGEFWLGNEIVHRLTNRSGVVYTLRVEVQLTTTGGWYYADYATFSLDSENNKYTLRLSGYNGSAGDSLTSDRWNSDCNLGGMKFSTWDADNDRLSGGHCASAHGMGWWINGCCLRACLTCPYRNSYFRWYSLDHVASDVSLRAARMMIRSN